MGKNRLWIVFAFFLYLPSLAGLSQSKKFVVFLKDKQGGNPFSINNPQAYLSPKSIQRRIRQNLLIDSTDLPCSPSYLNGITAAGGTVIYSLKWINAAVISCTPEILNTILDLPFVLDSRPLNSRIVSPVVNKVPRNGTQSLDYGQSFIQNSMLGIDSMHSWGYRGEGITIAVLDGGFYNVNSHAAFSHLFQNNRILGIRDLVSNDGNVYGDHWHGGSVLSNIGGLLPGNLVGGAYNANYFLIRSEDVGSEYEIECAYWVAGLELADSIGADLVNSSLGYTTFDLPGLSYEYSNLDGNFSIASRSAAKAASKGMIVVCSAGNEGANSSWGGWIAAPSDADNILTIGSVDANEMYSSFSGKGPTADGRIKPDLVAQGGAATIANMFSTNGITTNSGTSFSAPILCGLAAGFWQAHPNLSAMEVMAMLKNSGSNRQNPNNTIGWGIPGFIRAHILAGAKPVLSFPFDLHVFPNPTSGKILNISLLETKATGLADYRIVDSKGRILQADRLFFDLNNQTQSVEIPRLKPGIYFIRIDMGGKEFHRKLVVN